MHLNLNRWIVFAGICVLHACGKPAPNSETYAADSERETAALKAFPWLVKVSSDYVDSDDPNGGMTISGFGFVVTVENRPYVITTSHLSQGKVEIVSKTRSARGIMVGGFNQIQLRRYDPARQQLIDVAHGLAISDNLHDIEVIALNTSEDNGSPQALGSLCTVPLQGTAQLAICVADELLPDLEGARNLDGNRYLPLGVKGFVPNVGINSNQKDYPLLGSNPAQVSSALQVDPDFVSPFRHDTGFDIIDDQLLSPAGFASGMSGLPFIRSSPTQRPAILGVVQSRALDFTAGWMTEVGHAIQLMTVLDPIVKRGGPRSAGVPSVMSVADGYGVQSEWQLINGQLVRFGRALRLDLMFYESLLESGDPTNSAANMAGREPSGNGSRSDTGNGSRSDTGEGAATAIQHIRKYKWGMAVQSEKLGVREWMPVSSMFVETGNEGHLFPANLSSIGVISAIAKYNAERNIRWKIHFINPDANILPYLRQQLRRQTTPISADHLATDVAIERFHFASGTRPFRSELHYSFAESQLNISLRLSEARLEFTLGQKGELIGGNQPHFTPVVEILGSDQKIYHIDLSNLLFFDASKGSTKYAAFRNRFMIRQGDIPYVLYNRFAFREERHD